MKLIVKLFPEITIKSKSVRLYFIKILTNNISIILLSFKNFYKIRCHWDYIEISVTNNDYHFFLMLVKKLVCIPGINHILLVEEFFFSDMYDIYEKVFSSYHDRLIGKSFCIRVKRRGKHNFTSQDIERYLGSMLLENIKNTKVQLKKSEQKICLEIKENCCLLIRNRYGGLGGFPIGTQGEVLSLISGGFDSAVSSYMLIRRGCKVHYCFFKIGGVEHESCVRKIVYYLWKEFSSSHIVKFIMVDFSSVICEIMEKVHGSYVGIVLKRMMIRVASVFADRLNFSALVTGEVLGQVSSQTLVNLRLINSITDIMIFRPLISYDKEQIISISKKIGMEDFFHTIPEYCGIFSKHPIIKGSQKSVELEENKIDFSILDIAIVNSYIMDINEVISNFKYQHDVLKCISKPNPGDVIIDVRSKLEESIHPLNLLNQIVQIKKIPFYKLSSSLFMLDKNTTYLLYCERGIISRWQALYLKSQGFCNVFIYLP